MPAIRFLATTVSSGNTTANFNWGSMSVNPAIAASNFFTSANGTWHSDIASHSESNVALWLQLSPVGSTAWVTVWTLVSSVNTSLNNRSGSFPPLTFNGIRWDSDHDLNQTFHDMNSVNNIITFTGTGRPTRSVNVTQLGRVRRGIYSP